MPSASGRAPSGESFTRSCSPLGPGELVVVTALIALASWLVWWWDFWGWWNWGAPLERLTDAALIMLGVALWLWLAGNRIEVRIDPAGGTLTARRRWLFLPVRSASYPLAEVSTLRLVSQPRSSTGWDLMVVLRGDRRYHLSLGSIGALGQERVERQVLRPALERLHERP